MAIYSEPNSFYQLNNPVNFGCQEPIPICLPVYEDADLHGFHLNTNDSPTATQNAGDEGSYPLVSYSYRLVSNCNEPIILSDTVKHYNQFFYVRNQVTNDWILLPFNDDDDEPNAFPGFNFQCDECFFIQIIKTVRGENPDQQSQTDRYIYTNTIVGCIGCFKKICDPCYTTLIRYRNNENAFGFNYNNQNFYNSVRLPIYLKQPQFPTVRNVFTLSNGNKKKLSSRIEKEWIVETDWMPKEWHEKLVIALEHDRVGIINTNSNLTSEVMMESSYEIEWQDYLDYPLAKAKFKLKQIPYNNVNSNCK